MKLSAKAHFYGEIRGDILVYARMRSATRTWHNRVCWSFRRSIFRKPRSINSGDETLLSLSPVLFYCLETWPVLSSQCFEMTRYPVSLLFTLIGVIGTSRGAGVFLPAAVKQCMLLRPQRRYFQLEFLYMRLSLLSLESWGRREWSEEFQWGVMPCCLRNVCRSRFFRVSYSRFKRV